MTQHNHTAKFIVGVSGIYVAYMLYGIMQEKIFKTQYQSVTGGEKGKFKFPFILLFTQCLFSTVLAHIVNLKDKKEQALMGLYNLTSMLGSNTALQFMSYPLQALFKSCKVLSVLIVGLCFGKVNYPMSQYICGVFVTAGIIGFNMLEDTKGSKETQAFGIILILLSLFSDGMLAEKQAELRQKYKPSSFQLMEMCSLYCLIFSFIYGLVIGQIKQCIQFMMDHNGISFDIFLIGMLGCVGQVFIFFTIKHFGPVILAIVTTTRKFFTVLASIVLFGHHIKGGQWFCVLIVLAGVGVELYESYQKNSKPHAKKQEDTDKQNKEKNSKKKDSKLEMLQELHIQSENNELLSKKHMTE